MSFVKPCGPVGELFLGEDDVRAESEVVVLDKGVGIVA